MAFAVPVGLCSAIYISEVAPKSFRNIIKPVCELFAGIPSVVYGFFGLMVLGDFAPDAYWEQIACVLIGCFGLALGVYLQIIADFTMVPGDGFAYALSVRIKRKPYRVVRVCSDVTMIVIAALLGFIAMGGTGGVRESTVICALLIGTIAGVYFSKLKWLTDRLFPEDARETMVSTEPAEGSGASGQ